MQLQPSNTESLDRALSLRNYLKTLQPFLQNPATNEVVINSEKVVFIETSSGWQRHDVPELDFKTLETLAGLIANYSKQAISAEKPILSATLPDGERVQVVIPPATRQGSVSITIRKPSKVRYTFDDYETQGAFSEVSFGNDTGLLDHQKKLIELKNSKNTLEFLKLAVLSHQNILISGATGSGKTTFGKAFVEFVPRHERLISIENTDELELLKTHENSTALFYSAGGQGLANVSPQQLMQSVLRMKPDRVFLAELITGDEAFYFLDTVSSGHPGSISTMHSDSCTLCAERLINLIRRSKDGATMSTEDIRKMVYMCIDVIVQFKVVIGPDGKYSRKVTEIYYEPEYKKSLMA